MRVWSQRDVWAYLGRVEPVLDRLDHFSILDISVDASEKEIQKAFHNMAAGLHPDRHRHDLTEDQHERLVIVYARIAEAYRVLRTAESRDKYCREMVKKSAAEVSETGSENVTSEQDALAMLSPKARQMYHRAIAAKRTGDRSSAVLNMRMALAKHPQSSFLKAALKRIS